VQHIEASFNQEFDMYFNAMTFYRLGRWTRDHNLPFLPKVCEILQFLLFNSVIPVSATIGAGTSCDHRGIAVVVHSRAQLGKNCRIWPQVLIGGRSGAQGVPVIGNNVMLSAGAKVLGPIRVGDNVIVGANAVVIHDVPDNSTVVGVPGRILNPKDAEEPGG
jgi:serine O-acetyltransferase